MGKINISTCFRSLFSSNIEFQFETRVLKSTSKITKVFSLTLPPGAYQTLPLGLVHIKHCHLVHIKAIRSQEGATSSSSSDFSLPENWKQVKALNCLPFPYFCFQKLTNSNLKTHPFCWEPSPAEFFVAQPSDRYKYIDISRSNWTWSDLIHHNPDLPNPHHSVEVRKESVGKIGMVESQP